MFFNNINEHKASFDVYNYAVQTSRARIYTMDEQEEWLKATANGGAITSDDLAPLPSGLLWQYFMIGTAQACHRGRFFSTESRYFGLGPAAMSGDDIFCCILWRYRSLHSAKAWQYLLARRRSIYTRYNEWRSPSRFGRVVSWRKLISNSSK
jgi:hypothetical protein